ncbi:MAG: tetratricopeptide repeat protein [Lysobacterales bacterium]
MPSTDFPADETTEFQAAPAGATAGVALQPGAQLGVYVIRSVLGEGGMGRVYLAEQMRPVRRAVALKLIREQVASPLARAYFDVERQALAQMQHPAIAQVFDAGTTADGHPYLAMEVVEGRPLTRFCTDEKLGRNERLALFARVCHGVQHAHQKGIIHRDLKPANVLVRRVDGEPAPKIIDFGIAIGGATSAAGASVEAAAADRAGTAIYMSPEQAGSEQRDLDTRSDVYSLGVMLYEVLTDADAAALTSLAHHSARAPHRTLLAAIDSDAGPGEATPTSAALLQASRALPAELRAILRKALAAERADRYDSAAALADDLERFRDWRPVKALPQTRLYLARTFVARHRLGLVATSLAAAALLAGTVLALHGLARAEQSAAVAKVEAAKAAQVADFVRGMLAGIDPDRAKSMDRSLMRLVLDSAAERAGRELAGQPAVRASIEHTIADSYASLGELKLAGTHYDAAITAARAAGAPPAELARVTMRGAENLDNQGNAKDALAGGERAFALVAGLAPDDRDRLFIESHLAGLECDAGQLEASRTRYLRVLKAQRRQFGDADEDTLASIDGLAITDSDLARFDEARPLYETLIARRRARYGDEHSKTLNAINGLAVLELEQKHYAAAEKLLGPQLPVYERVFGAEHPMTLRLISNLGGAIRQQGRNEEARPYYERALALAQKLFGPHSPTTVMAEANLAALLRDAGQLAPAEQHARAATANADEAFGDNAIRAIMFKELATVLVREQRYADAERELDHAWQILSVAKGYGPTHPRSQEIIDAYVELYAAWKKPEREAIWHARKTAVAANTGTS